MSSNEYAFVSVQTKATLASVNVNATLTVNTTTDILHPDVQTGPITTTLLQFPGTGGEVITKGNALRVGIGAGAPLSVTSNTDSIVFQATTTELSGGSFAPADGITATATFAAAMSSQVLTFTSGVLTSYTGGGGGPTTIMSINTANVSTGSSDAQSFALPLVSTGVYNFDVAWGDGSSSTITTYDQPEATHTYATTGSYTLQITGTLTGWSFGGAGDQLKLVDISAWGDRILGTTEGGYFSGCANLDISASTGSPLRPTTTSLSRCFSGCTSLTGATSNIGAWDVSAVTDMTSLFDSCSLFNLNLSAWDTSSVTTMARMFNTATAFNNGNTALTFDATALITTFNMFRECANFNQTFVLTHPTNWTTASFMFMNAVRFNNGDTGDTGGKPMLWLINATQLQNTSVMFFGCNVFNQTVPSLSQVSNASSMFANCLLFNNGDTGNTGTSALTWATTALTDVNSMFQNSPKFNQSVTFGSMLLVTNATRMFDGAALFNNGDTSNTGTHALLGATWSMPDVTSVSFMFNGCSVFNQTLGFTTDISALTTTSSMLAGCTLFNNGSTVDDAANALTFTTTATLIDTSSMFFGCNAFNQTLTVADTTSVTTMTQMFDGCTRFNNGVTSNAGGEELAFLTTIALNDTSQMFFNCAAFNQTVSFLTTGGVTTMAQMFSGCSLFNNGDTGNNGTIPLVFTTSAALSDMSQMFANCGAFNQTLVASDTTGVTTMLSMFLNCALFNNSSTVDDAGHALTWTTSNNLANMANMFRGCAAFNQTFGFSDMTGVTTMASLFNGCSVFNNGGLALTFTTTSALTDVSFMFRFCSVFNQTFVLSDTTGVTTMAWMFTACALFNNGSATNDGLNPLTFTTSSALRDVSQMFILCEQFNQTLLLSNTTGMTAMAGMFFGCGIFNNGVTSNAGGRGLTFTTTSALAEVELMFNDCAAFNQEVVLSDMTGITTTGGMFLGCSVFNNGDTANVALHPLTLTTTSALTNTSNMFSGCSVFNQKLNVSNLSGVLTAESMFSACTLFNNGDTTNMSSKALVWTTSTLLNTTSMFANCAAFNQALTFSDMSHVGDMGSMLQNCNLFKQDLSAWQVTACANFNNFYTGDINNPNSLVNQTNYDALLTSWAAQAVRSSVIFTMGTSKYSAAVAGAARTTLTGTYSWTVNDGGAAP